MQLLKKPEPNEFSVATEDTFDSNIYLSDVSKRTLKGWSILEGISSSPSIATEIISTSGWIELLGVLVGYTNFTKVLTARVGSAKTLSRLMWDPNVGPSTGTSFSFILFF